MRPMATTDTVLGVFSHVDTTVRALEDVLERDRPVSRVRLFALVGGLLGLAAAWLLTQWTSLKWDLVVGGKPAIGVPVSPPYIVIMFEMMVLFGGIATVIGMVVLGRLPRIRVSPSFDPRFTNDRFGVAVHCTPERGASVRDILRHAGADEVRA